MTKIIKSFFVFLIMLVWVFSGWPRIWQNPSIPPKIQEAQANTTGEVYPTLGESVREPPWSNEVWLTPENIYTDDGNTANVLGKNFDDPDQTRVLKATGFGFSAIPDNSTIQGVIVRVNSWYRSGQGSGSMDLLQLLDTSKAKVGTNQCATPVALSTDDTTIITKGSSGDLWGNALTAAWVKNANFGVAIGILATAANADVDVDYVTIEIYYTPPAVSVTLDQETFDYGIMNNNTASSTLALWAGVGITATNGDVIANFSIYGADTTGGGSGWTLAADNTGNNYIHKFCNDTDDDCTSPPTNYSTLTTSPQDLKLNVGPAGTIAFQLQITTPQTPTDVSVQSAVVTVQASAP